MENKDLFIEKNGELVYKNYEYTENEQKIYIYEENITDFFLSKLFEPCELGEITLRDIFLLIQKHEDLCCILYGDWVRDIIEEAFSEKKSRCRNSFEEIEYVELYWHLETSIYKSQQDLAHLRFPSLHGVGIELPDDYEGWKKSDRIQWGIDFTPLYELIDLPIKFNTFVKLYDLENNYKETLLGNHFATLGQILYGIIWELTFYGSPKERDKVFSKIQENYENCLKDCLKDNNVC